MINEIDILTTNIPLILAPTHIINIGAKAVLGSALNTTKNGSTIFARKGNSYNNIAINKPNIVPKSNPKITS